MMRYEVGRRSRGYDAEAEADMGGSPGRVYASEYWSMSGKCLAGPDSLTKRVEG